MATTKTKIGNLFFNFRGEWDSTKTYIKDDVVLYNNSDYVCVKNTILQMMFLKRTKEDM